MTRLTVMLICASAGASAQITGLTVIGVSPTQALVRYEYLTATVCTLAVSESATFSPVVYDVDGSEFTNANLETGHIIRADLSATAGNTVRQVRIGYRTSGLGTDGYWRSRALATDTQYYLRVTCGANTASASFRTGVTAGIAPEQAPVDPASWGYVAYPEFDFSDLTKPIIDPHTGLKIFSSDPTQWSSRQTNAVTTNWFLGGSGWTTPANISQYSTANVATTGIGNTNPLTILFDYSTIHNQITPVGGYWPYANWLDLGIDIYGSGTAGASADRKFNICITVDSGQSCYTNNIAVDTLTSTLANLGPFFGTNTTPSAYFRGWSKRLPRNLYPRAGYVTVTAGRVFLTQNMDGSGCCGPLSAGSLFDREWTPGTKIYIAGSSPTCTNNICTIQTELSARDIQLVENLTVGTSFYKSAALGMIIAKQTTTGNASLNVRFETAEGYPTDIWSGGGACSPISVTSGDGITGYPCTFPYVRQGSSGLYFVGVSSPVIRLVSLFPVPSGVGPDAPNTALNHTGPSVNPFDISDPTTLYNVVGTAGGGVGIFKIHYTGTWMPLAAATYGSQDINPPFSSELTWTNVTPSASGLDIGSQILAHTAFNSFTWGSPTAALQFLGLSGPDIILQENVNNRSNAPCWIFAFNATNGAFHAAVRTDDGSTPLIHYAGCHAAAALDGSISAVLIANDNLVLFDTGTAYGGPFVPVITGKLLADGVTYSANTALAYPTAGTDFRVCPGGLPAWMVLNGASGNNCATLQIKEPCSSFPTASELSTSPCPWDPTKSYEGPIAPGDTIKDSDLGGPGDSEGMMVLTHATTGAGLATIVVQRDATFSYCTIPPRDGVNDAGRSTHANGWHAWAQPLQTCAANQMLLDFSTSTVYSVNQNIYRGHFALTTPGVRATTWTGAGSLDPQGDDAYTTKYQSPWGNLLDPIDWSTQAFKATPGFAGYNPGQFGSLQSYADSKQVAATTYATKFAFDMHHFNSGTGAEIEVPSQTIGASYTVHLQAGTVNTFKITVTGTPDPKHQSPIVWAGENVLSDISSPVIGNTITDATAFTYCYALNAGECRLSSSSGDFFISVPNYEIGDGGTIQCWASQLAVRIPCLFAGPPEGANAIQLRVSGADKGAWFYRNLGSLTTVPGAQYVYSRVLPTPDASYLLFPGYLTKGYHTGMMMAKLPPFPNDSFARNTFVPVTVTGHCITTCYAEFGYQEFGSDLGSKFYCTSRQENCRVAGSTINEATPFYYAYETFTKVSGFYSIQIPALPGHLLLYRIIDGASPNSGLIPVVVP